MAQQYALFIEPQKNAKKIFLKFVQFQQPGCQ